jgi:hypothetical protein
MLGFCRMPTGLPIASTPRGIERDSLTSERLNPICPISFACPSCGQSLSNIDPGYKGEPALCRICDTSIVGPHMAEMRSLSRGRIPSPRRDLDLVLSELAAFDFEAETTKHCAGI